MTSSVTVSEARSTLPRVLERVLAGEEVTLTRHGEVVAVIVRPDVLRVRRAEGAFLAAGEVRQLLLHSRTSPPGPGVSPERAEILVGDVRASRQGR